MDHLKVATLGPNFNSRAPIIYIHGARGTGKVTVARALVRWLATQGITAGICDHSDHIEREFMHMMHLPNYSALVAAKRRRVLHSIRFSENLRHTVMICTDDQIFAPVDTSSICWEYVHTAVASGRLFYPIYLACSQETLVQRGTAPQRPDYKIKCPEMLNWYARATIFRFPPQMMPLDLSTEDLRPESLAVSIGHFVTDTGGCTWKHLGRLRGQIALDDNRTLPATAAQGGHGSQVQLASAGGYGLSSVSADQGVQYGVMVPAAQRGHTFPSRPDRNGGGL